MAPSTMISSPMKQPAAAGSLVLVALAIVVGLAVLAGTSMAQQQDFLFVETKLDDQDKSVILELAKGDCGEAIFARSRFGPTNPIPCIDTLRSATPSDGNAVNGCCIQLVDMLDESCFCSIEKNQARLGIDLPKVCGQQRADSGRAKCAAVEESKRKEEVLNSLGACGQLFGRLASGEQFTVDGATPCAQQIATCSAGCQKQ